MDTLTTTPLKPSLLLRPSLRLHPILPHRPSTTTSRLSPLTTTTATTTTNKPILLSTTSPHNNPNQNNNKKPILTVPSHSKPSTGYAAALADIARCDNALHSASDDARRLLRALSPLLSNPAISHRKKSLVVKSVVEAGGFYRNLTKLVRMLVEKNKVGIVGDVLEEFGRIYDELCGAEVAVIVAAKEKMEVGELSRIAGGVGMASGAASVKVRHLFAV